MKKYLAASLLFLIPLVFEAQTLPQTGIDFFPKELTIHPFTANQLEPKLGFVFRTNSNQLWLNIGNSMDLLRIGNESETFSFGADLFTWTLLTREENFHFPVDAVDYMFGINFGYLRAAPHYSYGGRIRISHISAHFVDGHFDGQLHQWKDGRNPRVYSREFVETLGFYTFADLRIYAGGTYLFHVDPAGAGKGILQTGFEYFLKNAVVKNLSPYIAADGTLNAEEGKRNFTLHLGVKLGEIKGRGLRLFYQYYNGYDISGEYYDAKREYSAIGINLDL
ncbi:MAG: DUF1207 domain-containing protein [Melioribacteraceae bacterium]